jgi:probable HAF family extracellular repeat protein/YD repeat-containing protein
VGRFGAGRGFVTDGVTFTPIDIPGALGTAAYGINTAGQIVGYFWDATGYHGFLRDGATFTTLDVPGAIDTYALGINTAGQIVGYFWDGTRLRGFLKDGATFTAFDVPGARETLASGINTAGQIVGWFYDATGRIYGVNRTKVRKVSQEFSLICHINMLGAWQILGFVAFPSTFGGHLFFATHCQT